MASTVTKKQQKHTLSAKKINSLKTVLRSPYSEPNPILDNKVESELLDKLKKTVKRIISKDCKVSDLKDQFRLGVNETTKALEKDSLKLVLVNRTAHVITKHLFQLAGVRRCPLIVVSNLDSFCKPLPHLNRLSCLGFLKKSSQNGWDDFVDFAIKCAPVIDLPWLDFESTVLEQLNEDNEISGDTESHSQEETIHTDLKREGEDEESLKDFSYLYTYKNVSTDKTNNKDRDKKVDQKEDFGSAFLAFDSDSDDEFDEIVFQSGRIKMFPKQDRGKEVDTKHLPYKRKFNVLGLEQNAAPKKKSKDRTQRFFIDNQKGDAQKAMQYKTVKLEKMNPNDLRKKKRKR